MQHPESTEQGSGRKRLERQGASWANPAARASEAALPLPGRGPCDAWVEKHPGVAETEGWIDRPELAVVVATAAEVLGVDVAVWSEGRRSDSAGRALVATLCEEAYGYRGRVVAEALGYRSTSSVAACLKRIRGSISLMSACRRLVRSVRAELGG